MSTMFDAQIPIYGVYYVYMQFGSYSQLLPYIYILIHVYILVQTILTLIWETLKAGLL